MPYDVILGRNEDDRKQFGLKGTVFLGKQYVKMGQLTSLSNPIYLDVARSHVVFVCGKRGGGKCLTGDSLITLGNGLKVPIRDLAGNEENILALGFDLKIRSAIKEGFYKRFVNKILKVTLRSSKSIKLTPEHPLLTINGWEPAENLNIGTFIATPKKEAILRIRGNKKQMRYNGEQLSEVLLRACAFEISNNGQQLLQVPKEKLKLLAESDIFWDEIVSVEEINEPTEVYDISVPELHNFIANDIIVHNSYTMGVIAEGISDMPKEVRQNLSIIMLDTMGIYWTMKYPNQQDEALLKEWGIESKSLDVQIFTPVGFYKEYKEKGIPTDAPFSIKPSELSSVDWCTVFDVKTTDPIGVVIERNINLLGKEKENFSLKDIIQKIKEDDETDLNDRYAAMNRFMNAESWGLFSEEGTPLKDLAIAGKVSVLDVSCYATVPGSWNIKSLVIGLVAQNLFIQRMIYRRGEEYKSIHKSMHLFAEEEEEKTEMPLVWLVIDEAHEFLPNKGKTVATDPLITILREGRQPGISLILASQQPGKIHTDVMTQADIIISHRITAKIDTDALGTLMQSYMREGLDKFLNDLPRVQGSAIVVDDSNERIYPMKIRPRFTWHGGSAPQAIREEKRIF